MNYFVCKVMMIGLCLAGFAIFGQSATPSLTVDLSKTAPAARTADGTAVACTTQPGTVCEPAFYGNPALSGKNGGLELVPGKSWFNIDQGSAVFWIKPENWGNGEKSAEGKTSKLIPLFAVASPGGNDWSLLSYLTINPVSGVMVLDFRSIVFNPERRQVYGNNRVPPETLVRDQWNMLAYTWNTQELTVYVNGKRLVGASYGLPTAKTPKELWRVQILPAKWWNWSGGHEVGLAEVGFYPEALNAGEIAELYFAARLAQDKHEPARTTVPALSVPVELNGRIDADEWRDASRVPLMRTNDNGMLDTAKPAWAMFKQDGKTLYLAAAVSGAPRLAGQAGKADKAVYDGSLFEFSGRLPGAAQTACFQLAMGPNGSWMSRNPAGEWGTIPFEFKARVGENDWSVEAAVPLAALGMTVPGSYEAELMLHRPENRDLNGQWVLWNVNQPRKMFYDNLGVLELRSDALAFRVESLGDLCRGESRVITGGASAQAQILGSNAMTPDFRPEAGKLVPGSYVLKLDGRKAGQFHFESGFFVQEPFSFEIVSRPSRKQIELNLDATGFLKNSAGVPVTAEAILKDKDAKVLARAGGPVIQEGSTVVLAYENLPEGVYTIALTLAAGTRSITRVATLIRPSDVFLRDRKGLDGGVPAPWKPLDRNGHETMSTPFIAYHFDRGAFPVRVVSHGVTVADQAAVLTVTVNGRTMPFMPETQTRISASDEDVVNAGIMTAHGGKVKLTWRRKMHYDGLLRYDLKLEAAVKPVRIENLTLTVPVAAASARYSLSPIYNSEWTKSGAVDVFPNAWLTGERAGLTVFTDNDANWVYAKDTKPMKLRRNADGSGSIAVHLIEKPVTLSNLKPASYVLGLSGTPTKPPRADWRAIHDGGWGRLIGQNLQIIGWAGMPHWLFHRNYNFSQPIPAGFEYWSKAMSQRPAHLNRLMPYGYLSAMPDRNPIYDFYGAEWSYTVNGMRPPRFEEVRDPSDGENFYFGNPVCCNASGYADYITYYVDAYMKYPFVPGPYFDGSGVDACDTPYGDTDLKDVFNPNRKVYNNDIFGLRDIYERFYRITRKHRGEAGLVFAHSWQDYRPAVTSFIDIIYPGEEFMHSIMKGLQVYVESPLEQWQSNYSGMIYGASVQFLSQYRNYGGDLIRLPPETRRQYTKPLLMMCLIHDVPLSGTFYPDVEKVWSIMDQADVSAAEFHGYWQQKELQSDDDAVKVSFYRWKNRSDLLVMVGNLATENKSVRIRGLERYTVRDMVAEQPVDGKAPLAVENYGFRILALTPVSSEK